MCKKSSNKNIQVRTKYQHTLHELNPIFFAQQFFPNYPNITQKTCISDFIFAMTLEPEMRFLYLICIANTQRRSNK